jgi:hypothetical protein
MSFISDNLLIYIIQLVMTEYSMLYCKTMDEQIKQTRQIFDRLIGTLLTKPTSLSVKT